jgi:hypothetical protein
LGKLPFQKTLIAQINAKIEENLIDFWLEYSRTLAPTQIFQKIIEQGVKAATEPQSTNAPSTPVQKKEKSVEDLQKRLLEKANAPKEFLASYLKNDNIKNTFLERILFCWDHLFILWKAYMIDYACKKATKDYHVNIKNIFDKAQEYNAQHTLTSLLGTIRTIKDITPK